MFVETPFQRSGRVCLWELLCDPAPLWRLVDPLMAAAIRMSTNQGDHAPLHIPIRVTPQGGENMGANRKIGISDCNRYVQYGLKGLPDIQALSPAANKD